MQSQASVGYDSEGEVIGYNCSFGKGRERLVTPEELGYLKDESILLTPDGPCRIDKAFCYNVDFYERLIHPLELPRFYYEYDMIPGG